ncbi:hypothetical protein GCM10027521_35540 [Amycolatopsis cihanbeyliensis]
MPDVSPPSVVRLRFRRGTVGELNRTVHLTTDPRALASTEDTCPALALCGQELPAGAAEILPPDTTGMPCIGCLLRAPTPDDLPMIGADARCLPPEGGLP